MHIGRKHIGRRASAFGALLGALGMVVLTASPALAVGEDAQATGLQATGLINIPRTPAADCPGNGAPADAVGVDTTGLNIPLVVGVLEAECNTTGGTSTATGRAASVDLGTDNPLLPGDDRLRLTALEATCSSNEAGVATGGATLLDINGDPVNAPPNSTLVAPPSNPLLGIHVNEQKTEGGFFVVNALRISLFPGTPAAQEVIIGQAKCRSGRGVIPEAPLAVLLPMSAVGLFGAAYFVLRRRSGAPVAA